MKSIFHEKSYTKYGGETIPRPFCKKSKLSISLFIVCQAEGYRNILKLVVDHLLSPHIKLFYFKKKRLSLSALFCA